MLAVSREELAKVAGDGLTEEELVRAKGQLRGGLVLGLEDTGSRMSRLGESELFHERILGVDEVLDRIDAVSVDDVHAGRGRPVRRPRDAGARRTLLRPTLGG